MGTGRWEHIQAIFDAAIDRDPAERAALLDEACAGDPDARREVDSLLDAFDSAGPFDALVSSVSATLIAGADFLSGRRVGPYRVLNEIGRGGMGVVYLAERADGQFDRKVALKVMRLAVGTGTTSDRFMNERQILAQLTHPNIARLYDGGVVEAGLVGEPQPYFAMEYVEGTPIDAYADERRLDVNARLGLFLDVCGAVQYAHRNLVVHRDLKPSNILVTRDGEVKLLDFGIAKLVDASAGDMTVSLDWAMTPAYASPEQVRREAITTATDVYALGMILYELLSGRRPYMISNGSPAEIERTICEVEPRRPSALLNPSDEPKAGQPQGDRLEDVALRRGTTPEKLRRQLQGDLDNIVLKALHKNPADRYASADQLLEDVRRHLQGLPVKARPDSTAYRASRFVRRHRAGVAAAALVGLSLVGGIVATAWQARRATLQAQIAAEERDRAQLEAVRAAQVSTFLAGLFQGSDPVTALGDTLNAYEILERGAERIERELAEQPDVRASLMGVLSEVYVNLGDYERAESFANESLALRRGLYGDVHEETAQSVHYLADVKALRGEAAVSESLYTAVLGVRRRLHAGEHPALASVLDDLGDVLVNRGAYKEAEDAFVEALDQRRKLFGDEHEEIATSLVSVATAYYYQGRSSEAEPMFREALTMRRKLLPPTHPDIASSLNNLAVILEELGRYDEAEPLHREALQIRLEVLGPDHPRVAVNMSNLGLALMQLERLDEAESLLRDALALTMRQLGDEHPRVAIQKNNLGRLLHKRGYNEEAERVFRESLALRRRLLGAEHPDVALTMSNLASVLLDRGKLDEAVGLYRDAVSQFERFLPARHPNLANARSHLSKALTRKGHFAEAESLLVAAHRTLEAELGANDRRTRIAVQHLAELYEAWARPEDAAPYRAVLAGN